MWVNVLFFVEDSVMLDQAGMIFTLMEVIILNILLFKVS